ncbi:FAD-dependent oxidoreductase [Dictyobacter formicarum]|uniref:FAD/NAD(P)-binding domain-containing protein n=1 Tax=Dictyobacter formicarum TaxID=2778368 RepID=A0ABQ3VS39_9CHLR|nr:FAD-dependent oxidoreductase [Dictyobacter formicarum]GHO88536.1 hypothetical protein KSZ_65420 [Dictyobacter formicarum]
MPPTTNYNAIVIGTSQGGRFLPIAFAKAGCKVALIERGPMGGTCVNSGCTPTKTMVASARLAYQAKRGVDYGIHIGPISVDMQAIRKWKQSIVEGALRLKLNKNGYRGRCILSPGSLTRRR